MESLPTREELLDLKLKKLAVLEKERKYRDSLPHLYGFKKYKWQEEYCAAKFTHRKRFICAANQIGKVQPDFELVNTINGYKPMKDIQIGDFVFGSDGKHTKVIQTFEHKDWDFYKVTFHDKSYTYCGLEHLWKIKKGENYDVKSTQWIKEALENGFDIDIDYCKDLQYPMTDSSDGIEIPMLRAYWAAALCDILAKNVKARVPERILRGSIAERLGFLHGVMDLYASCCPSKFGGGILFSNYEHPVIDDLIKLVSSLGGYAYCMANNLYVSIPQGHDVFHKNNYIQNLYNSKYKNDQLKFKRFKRIEFHGKGNGKCILVGNSDNTYLTSKFNIVTHNSTIQIRDRIDVATNPSIWPIIWPRLASGNNNGAVPFSWYMYPNQDTVMQEFETKWIKEMLPRGEMEKHPQYGWKAYIVARVLKFIDFNTKFRIYFKTYNQDASDLQSGSVWSIDCFTAGHKIYCKDGVKKIEDVNVGDYILTRNGWNRVYRVLSRKHNVITRITNDCRIFEGTKDHPFILSDSIVNFDSLTKDMQLGTVPLWRYLCIFKQTLRLSYLKEIFIEGIVKGRMIGGQTTFVGHPINISTLQYGRVIIERKFLEVMSYIIKILIQWLTLLKILNYSQEKNTQDYINLKSGKNLKIKILSVSNVVKNFILGLVKEILIDIVVRNVEELLLKLSVNFAERKRKLDQILMQNSVQETVQTDQMVYNLSVETDHEYYVNGVLVHNCDEELHENLLPELEARMFATSGTFSMAFTATTGQDIWRRTIECIGEPNEMFPDAWKRQVSMYDCQKYADGSNSDWTTQRIETIKNSCKNEYEVARRVYGKFVLDSGLKYTGFSRARNFKKFPVGKDGIVFTGIPKGWDTVTAIDYGTGGDGGHYSAIVFLSYNSDCTKLRARVKRFDNFGDMTAGDLYTEYLNFQKVLGVVPVKKRFDGAAKDFGTISGRAGDTFKRANKDHAEGELALNTAFKLGILVIYDDTEGEGLKACIELESLTNTMVKRMGKDDIIDALRYAVVEVPVDWEKLLGQPTPLSKFTNQPKEGSVERERPRDADTGKFMSKQDEKESEQHYSEEFGYWNNQLSGDM